LALTVYGLVALGVMLRLGYWFSAIPTCLYLSGFASVGFSQLLQHSKDARDAVHHVSTMDVRHTSTL
jgi:hypothetical protein